MTLSSFFWAYIRHVPCSKPYSDSSTFEGPSPAVVISLAHKNRLDLGVYTRAPPEFELTSVYSYCATFSHSGNRHRRRMRAISTVM